MQLHFGLQLNYYYKDYQQTDKATDWCAWHHCISRLRVAGVYGTTLQAYSDGLHGTTAQAYSDRWWTWHHRTNILGQTVYMAPPHKHTQTDGLHGTTAQTYSDRWCTRHHLTSILRHIVYMAPPHKHTQTDGVHGTTLQAYSDRWCTWHHRTSILRWCTWHHRTNILRQMVYMAPPHKHIQTDGVHGSNTQTGSSEPVDIKTSSWLYFASQC
jgi:hypothetical protein